MGRQTPETAAIRHDHRHALATHAPIERATAAKPLTNEHKSTKNRTPDHTWRRRTLYGGSRHDTMRTYTRTPTKHIQQPRRERTADTTIETGCLWGRTLLARYRRSLEDRHTQGNASCHVDDISPLGAENRPPQRRAAACTKEANKPKHAANSNRDTRRRRWTTPRTPPL